MPHIDQQMGGFGDFAILGMVALIPAVLWLVIGWRAMRAHERIADAISELAKQQRPPEPPKTTFVHR